MDYVICWSEFNNVRADMVMFEYGFLRRQTYGLNLIVIYAYKCTSNITIALFKPMKRDR